MTDSQRLITLDLTSIRLTTLNSKLLKQINHIIQVFK